MPPATTFDQRSTDRALYALYGLFWFLMIVVALADEHDDPAIRWWQPLVWEGSSCLVATVWFVLARRMQRRQRDLLDHPSRWFARQAAWLPLVAITFVVAAYGIRHAIYGAAGLAYEHESWGYVLVYESIKLLLFSSLWLCIIFGVESFVRWQRERERLLELQKHLAESQLAQLRAQLQPHFLFNALNTISSLMQVDVPRADRLLTQLADLLRASLQTGARHTNSVREELNLLRLYSTIMQERFAGRVTVEWRVEADTLDASIPAMLLQPLLENSFRHGVERSSRPVEISIDAQRAGDDLTISIRNSGSLSPDAPGAGIGVANSRERLALLFGDRASLAVANEGNAVVARVSLPWQRHAA